VRKLHLSSFLPLIDIGIERTASGKILKSELRKLACIEWEKRQTKVSSKL